MTPTGHTGRVRPTGESRVAQSAVIDVVALFFVVFVVGALLSPVFVVGVVIGTTTTYATLDNATPAADTSHETV